MIYFHAPSEIIDDRNLIMEAMKARDIPLRCGAQDSFYGNVDDYDIFITLRRRFCANLAVKIEDRREDRGSAGLLSDIRALADGSVEEDVLRQRIQSRRRKREGLRTLKKIVTEVLLDLKIVPSKPSVEDEIEFVTVRYGDREDIHNLIAGFRQFQETVATSSPNQVFAVSYCDACERLMDQLFDTCAG